MKRDFTWDEIQEHYGGYYAATEAIFRAALFDEKPEQPFDWDDIISKFYVPVWALTWAIANCPKKFTADELGKIIEVAYSRAQRPRVW